MALFIGGPLDGQWLDVGESRTWCCVQMTREQVNFGALQARAELHYINYRREWLAGTDESGKIQDHSVFIVENLSTAGAMRLLLEHYHPKVAV